jgi:hypothetical protein
MDTSELANRLTTSLEPVRALRHPWYRAAVWLVLTAPYVALVVVVMSPRPDLGAKLADWRFAIEQSAALATGIAAAGAAFASTIPGLSRRFLLVAAAPAAVWLGSLGQGCIQAWVQAGPNGLALQPDWFCFPAILLVGTVPAIVMAVMLRRGAPLTPHTTAALGGLAAAGLGNFGLRFFHPQDASVMVLVWQVGTVVVLSAMAGWLGRLLLNWPAVLAMVRRRARLN